MKLTWTVSVKTHQQASLDVGSFLFFSVSCNQNNINNGAGADKEEQDVVTFTPFTEEELILFKSQTSKAKMQIPAASTPAFDVSGAELLW